jgi:hypothetical protein
MVVSYMTILSETRILSQTEIRMENCVTLVLNTREIGRENLGNLPEFFSSVDNSAKSPKNVELIFKLDNDDTESGVLLDKLQIEYPHIKVKYFHTPRYGYGGLHLGYAETRKFISQHSVAVLPVADDMPFVGRTEWDESCFSKSREFPDGIFLLQMAPLGTFTDGIFFSKKIVDLVGFGPTFAVDQWGFALSRMLIDAGMSNRIECITPCGGRKGCALDFPTNEKGLDRWNGDRHRAMVLIGSEYFKHLVEDARIKILNYLQSL